MQEEKRKDKIKDSERVSQEVFKRLFLVEAGLADMTWTWTLFSTLR